MDAIYSTCMKIVYDRLHKSQKSPLLANIPMPKFQARLKTSQRYHVSPSSNGIYQVNTPDAGRKYIVNLAEKECDCGFFYEYQSPCAHGIVAAKYQAAKPVPLTLPLPLRWPEPLIAAEIWTLSCNDGSSSRQDTLPARCPLSLPLPFTTSGFKRGNTCLPAGISTLPPRL